MKRKIKQPLAQFLVLIMLLQLLPIGAFASQSYDCKITSTTPKSLQVNGSGNYATLALALNQCTNPAQGGAPDKLEIQFGEGDTPLYITSVSYSYASNYSLNNATYTGKINLR